MRKTSRGIEEVCIVLHLNILHFREKIKFNPAMTEFLLNNI
jgi:hypothetical protein